jgi:hypothetical protein
MTTKLWPISDDVKADVVRQLHNIVVKTYVDDRSPIAACATLVMIDRVNQQARQLALQALRAGAVE